jgi:isoquinoline 1-oxidoreductase beta subunit
MKDKTLGATRRTFLKSGAIASAGLVLAVDFDSLGFGASGHPKSPVEFSPNAFIQIRSDNTIRVWVTRSEMGQGVRTTLPMMLADELEAEWSQIKLEQAPTVPRFKGIRLRTSGSGSTEGTYNVMRKAGAAARTMLIAAAAEKWSVEPGACRAQLGYVTHLASGRKLSYGTLAEAAARQHVPENPPLKDPKDFRYMGKPMKRTDGPAIMTGRAVYGLDTRVPGMLQAAMKRCPHIGGRVVSFDARKAMAIPGVRHVVPIKSGIATGVAVVADHTWAAMKGVEALEVTWDAGPNQDFDSDVFLREMESAVGEAGFFVRGDGDAEKALPSAARRIDAVFEFPFQAHAPLETMNCIANVRADTCEIWAPTQTPTTAQEEASKLLGLPVDSIKVNVTLLGGGFGRRLFVDYVPEAVELSKAIAKPVQLVWTRSDDMRYGFFQPPGIVKIMGGIDESGKAIAWKQTSVGCDLSMFGLPDEKALADSRHYFKDGSPWGAFDNPYNFPHLKAEFVRRNSPVPTGPWRAVEYPAQVFARESFIDEMAHAAHRDPLEFRLELLQPGDILAVGDQKIDRSRLIGVLKLAAEKAGWRNAPAAATGSDWGRDQLRNRGRDWGCGIACNVYDEDCFIAQIAEVSVGKATHDIRVHRIVCAVDCGRVINPLGIEGQTESGITWGLTAALHGRIDFKNGAAVQENFTDYEVIRMNEAPVVETHIMPSEHSPGGFGETAVPAVAPAVANAVFAATGKRVRRLPITSEKLQAASSAA